jgi:WD40 repeat protein
MLLTWLQIWDTRTKDAVTFIPTDFPITAICLAEAGNELFTGGIDNDIKVWDLRKQAVTYTLIGHADTVTSLQLSPDNQTLLSNAHDSTVRTWDVRPFAPADRSIMTFDGAPTGQERNLLKASWDSNGEKIAAGSGDQSVAIWESRTGKLLNKLPGHRGAVNDVRFHPLGEPLRKSQKLSLLHAMSSLTFVNRRSLRRGKLGKPRRLSKARSFFPATSPSFSKTFRTRAWSACISGDIPLGRRFFIASAFQRL